MIFLEPETPLLDRFSPISYAIGDYIHRCISRHGGYETCLRDSLNHVFIIQGMSLFRELGDGCARCEKLRKKFLDVAMGPVGDEQLMIAPAFWIAMVDIFGPCNIFVPGHSMATRGRQPIDVKCYVLVFVCPTTKLVNMQVIESKSADGIGDGINRLGCEIGIPSFVLTDQDSGIMKVLKEANVELKDLQLLLHKEKGIRFKTCPVTGHNFHGAVERKIRSVQDCLEKCDVANMRLHATGLQTLVKLVENDLNNLPLGYSYGRDSDNSPLLKLIFPNMLKIGRLNNRALDGPVRMPSGPGELMKKIEKGYSTFFKIWNSSMIPKLMKAHKWYKTGDQLQVNDVMYYQKVESELSSKWSIGIISEVEKGKDGLVRRVQIKYQNSSEDFPRYTDRAVRSLIKLFNIDDQNWQDEMAEVEKLVFDLQKTEKPDVQGYAMSRAGEGLKFRLTATANVSRSVGVETRAVVKIARTKFLKPCRKCCCISHCLFFDHGNGKVATDALELESCPQYMFSEMLDRSWLMYDQFEEDIVDVCDAEDHFMSLLCAVNTNLNDNCED